MTTFALRFAFTLCAAVLPDAANAAEIRLAFNGATPGERGANSRCVTGPTAAALCTRVCATWWSCASKRNRLGCGAKRGTLPRSMAT